jgi:hypothetical protein
MVHRILKLVFEKFFVPLISDDRVVV